MKTATVLLTFVCVILAGVCAWQGRELARKKQKLSETTIALEDERHARAEQASASQYLEARERDWKEKAMQLSGLVGTLRASQATQASNDLTAAQAANSGGLTNAGGGGMFGKGFGAMLSKMMKDPSMKEMMRAQQKMAVKKTYGPLIADLNLPPEQQQKLNDLLLDQQMQTIERSEMFNEGGIAMQKIGDTAKEIVKESDGAIEELLGTEKFHEFQEYKKTMPERMQLAEFKEQLQDTTNPVREDQTKQMLTVLKEERERYPPVFDTNKGEGKNFETLFQDGVMERQMEWQEDVNRRVQERLSGVLSPEQMKAYAAMQEQQLAMQKFGMKMTREMFGKGGVTGPGAPPVAVPAPEGQK